MVSESDRKVLGQSKLFRHISIDAIEEVLAECPVHALASGDVLIEPEQENHAVFIVLEGELSVQLAGREAFEVTHLGPGECVGEISMVDGQRPSARVEAAGPARVLVLGHAAMWALLNRSHGVAFNLLWILSGRMRDHNKALEKSRTRSLEFEHAASVDVLTGLHNRRWLDEVLPRQARRAEMQGEPLSVLMIDIDHFKRFNDEWGHAAGDFVLFGVAQVMRERLRPTDLLARYGGEELTAVLPKSDAPGAVIAAERVRRAIAFTPFEMQDGTVLPNVTISIGVAEARAGLSAAKLLAKADEALYRAKRNGRNRVES